MSIIIALWFVTIRGRVAWGITGDGCALNETAQMSRGKEVCMGCCSSSSWWHSCIVKPQWLVIHLVIMHMEAWVLALYVGHAIFKIINVPVLKVIKNPISINKGACAL